MKVQAFFREILHWNGQNDSQKKEKKGRNKKSAGTFPTGVNNRLQRLYGKTFVNVQLAISAITRCANIASNAFITEETL